MKLGKTYNLPFAGSQPVAYQWNRMKKSLPCEIFCNFFLPYAEKFVSLQADILFEIV